MTTDFQFPLNDFTIEYFNFIENTISPTEYFEFHHVYPKSIFGENNIFKKLSYADHFKAHRLLVKIYEEAGQKREYMQMAKAFFSFVHIGDYRKKFLLDLSPDKFDEIANLVSEAKIENYKSSVGENNPFYGRKHSPETISKILETKRQNKRTRTQEAIDASRKSYFEKDPDDIPRTWIHEITTKKNTKISNNDLKYKGIPDNYIIGRYTSDAIKLEQSLRASEFSIRMTYDWIKSGEDHHWYGSKNICNDETGENRRLYPGEEIPNGFRYGLIFTEEWEENRKIANEKKRGVPQPHVQLINRDPEKIRKTVEWHTGKTRGDGARKNISVGRKEFFANGGESATKGKFRLFNIITRKYGYFNACDIPTALLQNYTDKKTYKVKDKNGNHIYITDSEELPDGYSYAPNCGK